MKAESYSHTGPENNSPYHSAASSGAQSVYSPSVPSTGYFNVCSQILSRQMKERAAPLRDGSPRTECMSDWLLSYQLNLGSLQRRALPQAWRGQTSNKGFPNNTKSQIGVLSILRHYNAYSCSSSNFKLFFLNPPPLANSIYSVSVRSRKVQSFSFLDGGVGDTLRSFPSETAEGWMSVCNSRVKQQALEKLQRKFILSFFWFFFLETWVSICEGPFLHKWAHKPQCLFK